MKKLLMILMIAAAFTAGCKGGCGASGDAEFDPAKINEDNAIEEADKVLKAVDSL